ncbi:MAG: hypothetical protein H7252_05800 [Cytophaga sp.]|nr:hypothetical protein [Undibacterium sp.]
MPVTAKAKNDPIVEASQLLLPHERDEKPDAHSITPRKIMKQAYKDLQRCLVDTDLHGQRGVEDVLKNPNKSERKK